jgi:aerobic-type carbon monoxide dehydrogenase small subunit (CoxS/CutS family)
MIRLTVNGKPVAVEASPDTPLLWVLRDEVGLRGTKFGCGRGLCGACTVHVDGEAARSCVTPVSSVAGRAVRTIEGLASGDRLHPVQQAWMELGVPQCGYCQSGMIMAAARLLAAKPAPSDTDIDDAITNLCRCGTYRRVRAAIHRAAELARK